MFSCLSFGDVGLVVCKTMIFESGFCRGLLVVALAKTGDGGSCRSRRIGMPYLQV